MRVLPFVPLVTDEVRVDVRGAAPERRVPIRPTRQCRRKGLYKTQPACIASGNPLPAPTINAFAKLGTTRGGTPTIVGRLATRTGTRQPGPRKRRALPARLYVRCRRSRSLASAREAPVNRVVAHTRHDRSGPGNGCRVAGSRRRRPSCRRYGAMVAVPSPRSRAPRSGRTPRHAPASRRSSREGVRCAV